MWTRISTDSNDLPDRFSGVDEQLRHAIRRFFTRHPISESSPGYEGSIRRRSSGYRHQMTLIDIASRTVPKNQHIVRQRPALLGRVYQVTLRHISS